MFLKIKDIVVRIGFGIVALLYIALHGTLLYFITKGLLYLLPELVYMYNLARYYALGFYSFFAVIGLSILGLSLKAFFKSVQLLYWTITRPIYN